MTWICLIVRVNQKRHVILQLHVNRTIIGILRIVYVNQAQPQIHVTPQHLVQVDFIGIPMHAYVNLITK